MAVFVPLCGFTHLCQIAKNLKDAGVALRILEQQIDTSTPSGVLHFQMLGAIAEFETGLRRERQMEGIARARALGVHFGRVKQLTGEEAHALHCARLAGETINDLMATYRLSRASLYRYLAEAQEEYSAAGLAAAAD